MRPIRADDDRTDEFLAECGRESVRLGLAVGWTIGIAGAKAKQAGSWKGAKPFPNLEQAAGFYAERCRTRNPLHPVVASDLVGLELDGDEEELLAKYEIPPFPETVRVRSRRGVHVYLRPPEGRAPMKVEISGRAVTKSEDGVLIGAGALHSSGHVYRYNGRAEIAACPPELYDLLVRRADETAAELRDYLKDGGVIREGEAGRPAFVFHVALELAHDGLSEEEIFPAVMTINRKRCLPVLSEQEVRRQIRGAVVRARKKPRDPELEKLGREAERELEEWVQELPPGAEESSDDPEEPLGQPRAGTRRELFLPFDAIALSGPPRWIWRGMIPEGAVTLLVGRPKLGKSLLTVWLAAQLSRGLLEGDRRGSPGRTLLIAAEDPYDVVVKPRLLAAEGDGGLVGLLAAQGDQVDQGDQQSPREPDDPLDPLGRGAPYPRRLAIPDEYRLLERIVTENDVSLVVLDPINSFIASRIDAHRDKDIRSVLDPLGAMAARRHFAALAVVHLNRRADTDVLNRITGSGGYGGSARSILTFGRDPENETRRVVASEGNWQRDGRSDLFELREVEIFPEADPEDRTVPALAYVGKSDLGSSDLIEQLADDRSALEEAKEFLLGELAFGGVAVAELQRAAEAHGLSWITVKRAKKTLGVEARRVSEAGARPGAGRWEWYLELEEAQE